MTVWLKWGRGRGGHGEGAESSSSCVFGAQMEKANIAFTDTLVLNLHQIINTTLLAFTTLPNPNPNPVLLTVYQLYSSLS